jgi:Zn-dependent protease with chaperone function
MSAEFDFQKYVDRKKNPGGGKESRGGFGDYAFSGDIKVLRQLQRIAPVRVVVESSVRFVKTFQKNELLGTAVKLSRRQFPQLHDTVVECAETLDIPVPAVYVSQSPVINAFTFGTHDESYIVVKSGLVDKFSEAEVKFVIGHECGHIQNSHVVYQTAASFMAQGIGVYVKWASLPASMALNAWSRRAEITCDRAGLLCCKDEEVALMSLMKLAIGSEKLFDEVDIEEYLGQLGELQEGVGRFQELFARHPYLPKRVQALRLFAQSSYFQALTGERGGRPLDEVDREVEELISVI